MNQSNTKFHWFRLGLIWILSALLTKLTVIFGVTLLRVARVTYGRNIFLLLSAATSLASVGLGWNFFGLLFLAMAIMVFVYSEFLEKDWSPLSAVICGICSTIIFTVTSFSVWVFVQGKGWYLQIVNQLKEQIIHTPLLESQLTGGVDELLYLTPSGVLILLMFAGMLLLVLESKLLKVSKSNTGEIKISAPSRNFLLEFKTPDFLIWITMLGLLGAFSKIDQRWIHYLSVNILSVCVVLHFFQGLAVFQHFFVRLRISPFWKAIWSIILTLQLFLLVVAVGVIDYWADFRSRSGRQSAQTGKMS